ncbi:Phosphoribosylamine--glycine ligase [hydrothermal vent metagenome]|uniref:phosphoribosylamine--glycine ligase n=1 Tax=hydrothermal vent metagenome TaxID=652676 RepID=A0A3B0UB73_9ZZZZ
MNVLLIGGGGREHALAWAMARSPLLTALYAAPGNGGIAAIATLVDLDENDHGAVIAFCRTCEIGLVVIGPEAPLVGGLADALNAAGIRVFGPSAAAARLEGSKGFTKALAIEAGVPTGEYAWLDTEADAAAYLHGLDEGHLVIKADGLAAGKGVFMCETLAEAQEAIAAIFGGRFGSGTSVVIEEWLKGEEVSFFALCDGDTVLPLGSAQDHKRAFDGDTGPNTGGMGAYSPARALTPELEAQVMNRIVRPTARALAARGTPFCGVLFAGLMLTDEGPMLLEYNVRFGDPEAQVLMMRLKSDILELMLATAENRLAGHKPIWRQDAALTVIMAARGYPGPYDKGSAIGGLEAATRLPDVEIFHAGTKWRNGEFIATGGRVLGVTATGATLTQAQARAYEAVRAINWPGGFCRDDIGWRDIAREKEEDQSHDD